MSFAHASVLLTLPASPFPPLAVGFFGLATGYLIYGTQELFDYPKRDERADLAAGIWGIWMPGFMQFLAGTYLFLRADAVRHVYLPAALHGRAGVHRLWRALVRAGMDPAAAG